MAIPLLNARLCMDCDTIFEESRCPSCDSESYFPVSKWVRPAVATEKATVRKTARKASMVLLGTGAAFALWKLLGKPDSKLPEPAGEHFSADLETQPEPESDGAHSSRVRKRAFGGGSNGEG
jgi:hypothetical protein